MNILFTKLTKPCAKIGKFEPTCGLEPQTFSLPWKCSTTELCRHLSPNKTPRGHIRTSYHTKQKHASYCRVFVLCAIFTNLYDLPNCNHYLTISGNSNPLSRLEAKLSNAIPFIYTNTSSILGNCSKLCRNCSSMSPYRHGSSVIISPVK